MEVTNILCTRLDSRSVLYVLYSDDRGQFDYRSLPNPWETLCQGGNGMELSVELSYRVNSATVMSRGQFYNDPSIVFSGGLGKDASILPIIKNGIIYKSHFVNDIWESGISFNSIWKGGDFKNGIFKKGYWIEGTLSNGFFFGNSATQSTQFSLFSNYNYDSASRYMNWNDGNFLTGEFYQSTWSKGLFSSGRFYYSDFYSGRFANGTLGSKLISENLTKFGYYTPLS